MAKYNEYQCYGPKIKEDFAAFAFETGTPMGMSTFGALAIGGGIWHLKKVLAPCGVNDFVCGRATEWVSNGTDFCLAAGFRVKSSDIAHFASKETFCYGNKAILGSVADSWKASQFESTKKGENLVILDDFQQWARDMPFNERVSWAISGMVLTAGLVFISIVERIKKQLEDGKFDETTNSWSELENVISASTNNVEVIQQP